MLTNIDKTSIIRRGVSIVKTVSTKRDIRSI